MEKDAPLVDDQLAGHPRYDPFATRSRSRLFLITYEFQSGQYGVPFHHTVRARGRSAATKKAERYLDSFYGPRRESHWERTENTWYYHLGEVTVKLGSVEEVTPEEAVSRLLIL